MTNHGNVGPQIHKIDSEYWNLVAGKIICSENPNCNMSWLDQNIISPLEKKWGFIEVEKIGRTCWIKITEEGINASEFLI